MFEARDDRRREDKKIQASREKSSEKSKIGSVESFVLLPSLITG